MSPQPIDLPTARERIAAMQARLDPHGATFRPAPREPTACCGRGCDGCVWEGYYAALGWWLDAAAAALGPGRA